MNKTTRGLATAALILSGLGGWLLLGSPSAEPVRNQVLQDVAITEIEGQLGVAVRFPCPVSYLTHFPQEQGTELHIRLDPVQSCDRDAFAAREALRPEHAEVAALVEVSYEGDIEGGPFLNLRFNQPLAWRVRPDRDFRGLLVLIRRSDSEHITE